jgi:hypothetical protein
LARANTPIPIVATENKQEVHLEEAVLVGKSEVSEPGMGPVSRYLFD